MRRGGGRPSGTDGADFSYRMTVDDKYKRAAQARRHLRKYLTIQAAFVLFKALWATLLFLNGEPIKVTALIASVLGAASSLIGTLALKSTASPHSLKLFVLITSTSLSLTLIPLLTGEFFTKWTEASNNRDSHYKLVLVALEALQDAAVLLVQLLSLFTAFSLAKSIAL